MWVSDCGEVRAAFEPGRNSLIVTVPGCPRVVVTTRPHRGHAVWCGRSWKQGDDIDTVTVVQDGDELIVAHAWVRPFAAGGEADPRARSSEWRVARIIEEDEKS